MSAHHPLHEAFPVEKMFTVSTDAYLRDVGRDHGAYELRLVQVSAYSGLVCDLFRKSVPASAEAVTGITSVTIKAERGEYMRWSGVALIPKVGVRFAVASADPALEDIAGMLKELDEIDPLPVQPASNGRSPIMEAYGDQGSIADFVKELDELDPIVPR